MNTRPTSLRLKQAAAAVGQCSIMRLYDKFFNEYGKTIAQILLNDEDIKVEEKKKNLINTFDSLLDMDIIPIVNENDSVSYTEIESEDKLFGDNDMLSAVVAILCKAQKLVILSDIDGLYDKDPRFNKDAQLINKIESIDEKIQSFAAGAGSRRGTGGMVTKLKATKLATDQGIETVITNGKSPSSLYEIIKGESSGTLFTARNII
ncbi:glutamate 5-kinase [Priestia aryabhattai]|uniref:glutamate 5-kinase n=1 Tax=Priestia aryabhattai TaxID=412384 RepID=UPI001D7067B1|nr:glutamate 5-kinase [Priestia aryabhattai]MBY0073552.1 glutamate 5-kinase [Priestia aryabhattai]